MGRYRQEMVEKNKDGMAPMDAGPVTLGIRLLSSRSPQGYDAINYGRGTWLFHMLRTMLQDAAKEQGAKSSSLEEPFVRALRNVRERYQGKTISTQELFNTFAEELPPSLQYEHKKSLDWFLEGWVNGTALPRLELKACTSLPKEQRSRSPLPFFKKTLPKIWSPRFRSTALFRAVSQSSWDAFLPTATSPPST
jgi:aminopeptidase N